MGRSRLVFLIICLFSSVFCMGSCSNANTEAPGEESSHDREHLWLHASQASENINNCKVCHKDDLRGTNTAADCYSCHTQGPPFKIHELPFKDPGLHGQAALAGQKNCLGCHGTPPNIFDGGVVADPDLFDNPAGDCLECHPEAGAHPTNWWGPAGTNLSSHRAVAPEAIGTSCALCHQVTADGPAPYSAAPSCFSPTYTNSDGITSGCHFEGDGSTVPHELPFTDPALHGPAAKADLTACAVCHATPADAEPGGNPRFNRAIGSLASGCEDCHAEGTAHPIPLWSGSGETGHSSAGNMSVACALCHGIALDGAAGGGVAPACSSCHTEGPPLLHLDCTSCHSKPPDGSESPNRAGAHAVHQNLIGVTDNCDICHLGAGYGSPIHQIDDSQDVVISTQYTPKTGETPFYDPATHTCANVSCHGGDTTPDWYGGTIDAESQCQACHSGGTDQYNSYSSSEHVTHSSLGLTCLACHDPNILSNDHFADLATPEFEGNPTDTLRNCSSCH